MRKGEEEATSINGEREGGDDERKTRITLNKDLG